MADKEDLATLVASLGSGMVGAIAWLSGYQLIVAIAGAFIGVVFTFYFNSRMQRRAWRREATLRKVGDIYGPLYFEINGILENLKKDGNSYRVLSEREPERNWRSIKASYKYFLIDPNLRESLDGFFELLEQYDRNRSEKWTILENKLLPHLRDSFGTDAEAVTYQVYAEWANGTQASLPGGTLDGPIMAGVSPVDFTIRQFPRHSKPRLEVYIQRKGKTEPLFGVAKPSPELERKFDLMFQALAKEYNSDDNISSLAEQRAKLQAKGNSLRERLRLMTEEPWNV